MLGVAISTETRATEFLDTVNDARIAGKGLEIERLERAVQSLADRFAALRDENTKLARDVAERDQRIAELEGEVRRQGQTRREVARRIDDLVGQIDQLEGRLATRAD